MATSKKKKTLRISTAMTRDDLRKELQKAKRWLDASERAAAKHESVRRKAAATVSNTDLSVRRDSEVLRLREEVSALEQAAALHPTSPLGPHKLVRAVLIPGGGNEESNLRLTIDLIVNAETDVWDGKYYAVGFSGFLDSPEDLYPFVLRGDQIDYGAEGDADPLLKIGGKAVRQGESFAFFPDGEANPGRGGSYRVARIVTLLNGNK
ncbi:hypothetical protein [uncultured Brevundimonas sp.]|uniref:hypothetical protein n=1 Tax=uncultured Brevundimonas sp. TaxID=213418 RepID=UPI00261180F6|nr:hypothetical protein [uncultured Brevundimonas sp.]